MNNFPEDFNAENFLNSTDGNVTNCLAKYRQKIYDAFKYTRCGKMEIYLDSDFTDNIFYLLKKELANKHFEARIETRKEDFIVGGENDPEIETHQTRWLLISAN